MPKNRKTTQNKKPTKLRWEQINTVTWKLYDPDAPKTETPRCHGHWPGFFTNSALAWCLDVGQGWRVRVLTRGQWRAFGAIIDLDTAKKLALADIEGCRKNSRYEPGGGA